MESCGGDCVENNRIGLTKCVMAEVTHGDVQVCDVVNANKLKEEIGIEQEMAYATMFTFHYICNKICGIAYAREIITKNTERFAYNVWVAG